MGTTINERIKIAIESSVFKNVNAFSKHAGILRQTLSNVISGKAEPRYLLLASILRGLPSLSADWLMRGEGPMRRPVGGAPVGGVDARGRGDEPSEAASAARIARLEDEVRWLREMLASSMARRGAGEG